MKLRTARPLLTVLATLLFAALSTTACVRTDLSTDEGVSAALERANGRGLGERHQCLERLDSVDVIVVGDFAYDRGCMLLGAFINGSWLEAEQLASKALRRLGWSKLGSPQREELGRVFTEEVLFYGDGRFMNNAHEAFSLTDTPSFEEPKVWSEGTQVRLRAWLHEPSGMTPTHQFRQIEVTIEPEGKVHSRTATKFSLPMDRLR
jgi:hypothetical protein